MLVAAYVAGLIDGEGCIGFRLQEGKYLKVVVEVSMTNFEVLSEMHKQYGGSLHLRKEDTKPNRKPQIRWIVVTNDAKKVLEDVAPFLIVKRKQALLALKFLEFPDNNNLELNIKFKETMHILNNKGAVNE